MHIDVSGDTIAGVVTTGMNPVFLGKGGNTVFVVNGDNTVSTYPALSSLGATPQTVTLPGPPLPNQAITPVAGGTSSSGNLFVANRDSDNASVILGSLAVTNTIVLPAGSHPVAVAGNAANSKIYVVNQGTNNVTVVSTTDNTVIKTSPVGAQPRGRGEGRPDQVAAMAEGTQPGGAVCHDSVECVVGTGGIPESRSRSGGSRDGKRFGVSAGVRIR